MPQTRVPKLQNPIVIATQPGPRCPAVANLKRWLESHGLTCIVVTDADRLRWVASVQSAALVVVAAAATDPRWTLKMVEVGRAATPTGIAVFGSPSAPEVVALLAVGADSVVAERCDQEELLSRLMAIVRRTSIVETMGTRYFTCGDLRLDVWSQVVHLGGELVPLSPTEYKLLLNLMRNAGKAVSTDRLLEQVWGWRDGDGMNTLRIFVARLRRKLGDDARRSKFIQSVRGYGYIFACETVEESDGGSQSRQDQVHILDALARVAYSTAQHGDEHGAAQQIVQLLIAEETTDAAAIWQVRDGGLALIAHAGLSSDWQAAVGATIPLDESYATVHCLELGRSLHVWRRSSDWARYRRTAALLAAEQAEQAAFFPIVANGTAWGSLGVVRRSGQAYNPLAMAYFRAASAIYSACLTSLSTDARFPEPQLV